MYKINLLIFSVVVLFAFSFGFTVKASLYDWPDKVNTAGGQMNYNTASTTTEDDTRSSLLTYIAVLMKWVPFLGVNFIIQLVLGGYEWMTAGGEASKVEEAQKRIKNAVIGVILFLGTYVIAYFIVDKMLFISGQKAL